MILHFPQANGEATLKIAAQGEFQIGEKKGEN